MIPAVGAVAAALVAAVSVCAFLALRTFAGIKLLKASLNRLQREAEPRVRELAALAQEAATRAERVPQRIQGLKEIVSS